MGIMTGWAPCKTSGLSFGRYPLPPVSRETVNPLTMCVDVFTSALMLQRLIRDIIMKLHGGPCRYVLDMRVASEQRDDVAALVERIAPGAVASDRGGNHVSFSLPPRTLDIPTLFEQVRTIGFGTSFCTIHFFASVFWASECVRDTCMLALLPRL